MDEVGLNLEWEPIKQLKVPEEKADILSMKHMEGENSGEPLNKVEPLKKVKVAIQSAQNKIPAKF